MSFFLGYVMGRSAGGSGGGHGRGGGGGGMDIGPILKGLEDIEAAMERGFDFADRAEEAQILYYLREDLRENPVREVTQEQYKSYISMIEGLSGKSDDERVLAGLINPELSAVQEPFTPEQLRELKEALQDNMLRTEFNAMLEKMDAGEDYSALTHFRNFNQILVDTGAGFGLMTDADRYNRTLYHQISPHNAAIEAGIGLNAEQYDAFVFDVLKSKMADDVQRTTTAQNYDRIDDAYDALHGDVHLAMLYVAGRDGLDLNDPLHLEQVEEEIKARTGFSVETIEAQQLESAKIHVQRLLDEANERYSLAENSDLEQVCEDEGYDDVADGLARYYKEIRSIAHTTGISSSQWGAAGFPVEEIDALGQRITAMQLPERGAIASFFLGDKTEENKMACMGMRPSGM